MKFPRNRGRTFVMEERPLDMFSTVAVSMADEEITRMLADGTVTAMDSEAAVFAFVGLPYAEPWERK